MNLGRILRSSPLLVSIFFLVIIVFRSQAGAAELQLLWTDNSNNEDGFKIERKTGTGGTYAEVAVLPPNTTSHIDASLVGGVAYCYRLRAFNSAGHSTYTPDGCATAKSTVESFTLTVSKTGNGTVTSGPGGINCGSDCSESYNTGTMVTLTATPAADSLFTGWTGNGCSNGVVAMNADITCKATFSAKRSLTISVAQSGTGNGSVVSTPAGINCGSDCSEVYPNGTEVVLNAIAAPGSVFSGWSGSNDCSDGKLTMNSNKSCTATFNAQVPQTFVLSIGKTGTGGGIVTSIPAGINCGADCSEAYTHGSVVTLSVIPAPGSVFSGWAGNGCGMGGVTMDRIRSCTAIFRRVGQQVGRIGVFRPNTGGWYLDDGNGSWDGCEVDTCYAFGTSGDEPLPRDYDGDGSADVAVYRHGSWYVLRSSDGDVTAVGWGGLAQDKPVPADYDGDGKADIAVYRDGMWYIVRSSDGGVTTVGWGGLAQDKPVPADYDGDGKADVAVYRDGNWYIIRSSDGGIVFGQVGGAVGDIPLN